MTQTPTSGKTAITKLDVDFYRAGSILLEYVILSNPSDIPIDVAGLTVEIPTAQRKVKDLNQHTYTFGSRAVISAHDTLVIRATAPDGHHFNAGLPLFYSDLKEDYTDTVELRFGGDLVKSASKGHGDPETQSKDPPEPTTIWTPPPAPKPEPEPAPAPTVRQPRFRLEQSKIPLGATIKLIFDAPISDSPEVQSVWVTVAAPGEPPSNYTRGWCYVNAGETSATLKCPTTKGTYEVRLFTNYPAQSYHMPQSVPLTVS